MSKYARLNCSLVCLYFSSSTSKGTVDTDNILVLTLLFFRLPDTRSILFAFLSWEISSNARSYAVQKSPQSLIASGGEIDRISHVTFLFLTLQSRFSRISSNPATFRARTIFPWMCIVPKYVLGVSITSLAGKSCSTVIEEIPRYHRPNFFNLSCSNNGC